MKKTYAILLGFTAILLAATAAYFSVFGLSKLFMGASISVVIMAAILEFSKIVAVTYLHQYWKKIALAIKAYLVSGVIVLMVITSVGIYGFLSSAYSRVSVELAKIDGDTDLLDKKIDIKTEERDRLNEQIQTRNNRILSLTDLRRNQENRLDTLYMRGWISRARETENTIKDADKNIAFLHEEINSINTKIETVNDSIYKYETQKLEMANSDISGEIGPLRYISDLTNTEMSRVVNWLILMLILVFDPMAVALIISASGVVKMIKEEKEKNISNDSDKLIGNNITDTPLLTKETETPDVAEYLSNESGRFELVNAKNRVNDKIRKLSEEIDKSNSGFELSEDEKLNEDVGESVIEEMVEDIIEDVHEEMVEDVVEDIVEDVDEEIVEDVVEDIDEEINDELFVETTESANTFQELEGLNEDVEFNNNLDIPFPEEVATSIDEVESSKVFIDSTHKQTLYSKLLDVFYDNGKKSSGDELPEYVSFRNKVNKEYTGISEKDIKDFLLICNLFKITDFKEGKRCFEKSYYDAKNLILKI